MVEDRFTGAHGSDGSAAERIDNCHNILANVLPVALITGRQVASLSRYKHEL